MLKTEQVKSDSEQLHEYAIVRCGHNWRFDTWRKKYDARLRKYTLADCMLAVDGFVSMRWYMDHHSQDAVDLIFRSDGQLEKFLEVGRKLMTKVRIEKEYDQTAADRKQKHISIRERLSLAHVAAQERLRKRLAPLQDQVAAVSWSVWIEPLLYVGLEEDAIILYHKNASWVQEHYGSMIATTLNRAVKIVSEVPE